MLIQLRLKRRRHDICDHAIGITTIYSIFPASSLHQAGGKHKLYSYLNYQRKSTMSSSSTARALQTRIGWADFPLEVRQTITRELIEVCDAGVDWSGSKLGEQVSEDVVADKSRSTSSSDNFPPIAWADETTSITFVDDESMSTNLPFDFLANVSYTFGHDDCIRPLKQHAAHVDYVIKRYREYIDCLKNFPEHFDYGACYGCRFGHYRFHSKDFALNHAYEKFIKYSKKKNAIDHVLETLEAQEVGSFQMQAAQD